MAEFEAVPQNLGDMGQEPPKTAVGAATGGDKVERTMDIIRTMNPNELRQLVFNVEILLINPL